MKDKIAFAIGAWFGCGYMPAARGTWGALCALLLGWPLARFAGFLPWHFGVLALLFTPPAIWAATRVAERVGRKDPNLVVVDEVAGSMAGVGRRFGPISISLCGPSASPRLYRTRNPESVLNTGLTCF